MVIITTEEGKTIVSLSRFVSVVSFLSRHLPFLFHGSVAIAARCERGQERKEGERRARRSFRGETDAITECRNAYNHRRYRLNAEAATMTEDAPLRARVYFGFSDDRATDEVACPRCAESKTHARYHVYGIELTFSLCKNKKSTERG